jgi:hypothetical protein
MTVDISTCPNCGGAIPREHSAEIRTHWYTETLIYCEFCERGWEFSASRDGEFLSLDYHARTEPVNFGRFLERLDRARVA